MEKKDSSGIQGETEFSNNYKDLISTWDVQASDNQPFDVDIMKKIWGNTEVSDYAYILHKSWMIKLIVMYIQLWSIEGKISFYVWRQDNDCISRIRLPYLEESLQNDIELRDLLKRNTQKKSGDYRFQTSIQSYLGEISLSPIYIMTVSKKDHEELIEWLSKFETHP